ENIEILKKTRPTAINLSWALERIRNIAKNSESLPTPKLWERLLNEAKAIHKEDIQMCEAIAEHGYKLLPEKVNVITYCNTGGLATGGLGTALGIIIKAFQKGKDIHVYVSETRPLLQGARLTAWELSKEKVPFTLCTDNMTAYIMTNKNINAVIVGADRIAANGDTANKIGTYSLAILAKFHKIPFYVAAPTSTIDPTIPSGKDIVIEQRSGLEVTNFLGKYIAPKNCPAISPAFDVTPANFITRIITEKGVFKQPFHLFQKSHLKKE
ncbi:MAG: S-methyl-5-thioribose-1-phosphate isomerase, partial [Candidatus Marinimicrobia bacterium]|nr:S-methyl-5-thioribose-1-phosphate isomerase [Candidatus Neomarinimicrobiota bacterium]